MNQGGEEMRRSMATLAHEMRSPLGSLRMVCAALRHGGSGRPELHTALDIIDRSISGATRLVDDVEIASRSSAGKLTLALETLSLQAVLQASSEVALSRLGTGTRAVDLLMPGPAISLQGDRQRLQQVFANLIGNAIKFTADGGRIWIKATVEGVQAVVRVQDDSAGIAPGMLERISEMFTQADTAVAIQGMGIGLAVAKEVVELHGGSVQARSEGPGKGSEFTVRLPLRRSQRVDTPGG